jgi:hypothetical protein
MDGKTLWAAAGKCERTARRWQDGPLPSATKTSRTWRTREDPFADVWASEVVPRPAADEQGRLQALTLFYWLCVTIQGDAFPHLFFEWVLSFSGWPYVALAVSETFEALVAGLQGAVWTLGAVPAVIRHDNLSAATHELKR